MAFLWYAFRFPTSQVRDLPSDLLYRVLPKSDQTHTNNRAGEFLPISNETARTVQNFNPGTPLGGVASVAARGAAAVVGASREDTEWVRSGRRIWRCRERGLGGTRVRVTRHCSCSGRRSQTATRGQVEPAADLRNLQQSRLRNGRGFRPRWRRPRRVSRVGTPCRIGRSRRPTQIEAVLKQSDMQVGARPSNPATLQAGTEKGQSATRSRTWVLTNWGSPLQRET